MEQTKLMKENVNEFKEEVAGVPNKSNIRGFTAVYYLELTNGPHHQLLPPGFFLETVIFTIF